MRNILFVQVNVYHCLAHPNAVYGEAVFAS